MQFCLINIKYVIPVKICLIFKIQTKRLSLTIKNNIQNDHLRFSIRLLLKMIFFKLYLRFLQIPIPIFIVKHTCKAVNMYTLTVK